MIKKLLFIYSLSIGFNTVSNITENKINQLKNNGHKKIDVFLKPGEHKISDFTFQILNYGKYNCDTFDDYAKKHQYYSDPSYNLFSKIGNSDKWIQNNNWLLYPTLTSEIQNIFNKKRTRIYNLWTNDLKTRHTYISIIEVLENNEITRSVNINFEIWAYNQNKYEKINYAIFI